MGASSSRAVVPERKDSEDEMVLNVLIRVDVKAVSKDLHVEIGDQNAVKNMLDDTVVEFFKDKEDMKLHYGWDNAKILLMVLDTAIAAVAHFFKHPAIPDHGSSGKLILVRTTFPQTESHYTISIHHADAKEKQRKEELYVGRYFDNDGYFSKDAFIKDIETIFSRFEMKDKKQ
ncbi:hypothetical protein PsorP6_013708 [Peronosclerospora sorghi]|uniref:Uncharacterized protein n=1 Tax=Peronosclerospora sorghi TaxID=230839 RepID=A0ACC0VHA4_9STRA|nr:hypothetical protein PsorP6_013708 [Peronosclerospora sorghi]